MPGLPATASRCAPAITTLWVSPVLVCATTFRDFTMAALASSVNTTAASVRRSAASASASITPTGTFRPLVVARREQPLRAARRAGIADDEKPDGALGDGGVLLVDDRATGVVDDGDGAGHPLRPVVGGRTARGFLRPQRDGAQPAGRGGRQQRCLVDGICAAGHGECRLPGRCHAQLLEFRGLNVKTLVPQRLCDVVHAGVISWACLRRGSALLVSAISCSLRR